MSVPNREFKDRLFSFIYGSDENRAWTLSLYNAVSGRNYTDPSLIEITTIREIVYLSMHNDVSFIISDEMNLYEQQSTYNPNMPLRLLEYSVMLYEKYLMANRHNKLGSRLIPLPVPKLVVFYNGTRNMDDETILRLSDSFPEGADADIEVRVRMINVNHGHSAALLNACESLREYAWLVAEIRKNQKTAEFDEAVDRAVAAMPSEFEIKPFLDQHRAEVKGMLLTEYNEAEVMELFKEEGLAQGREEGRAEGREEAILSAAQNVAAKFHISLDEARAIVAAI